MITACIAFLSHVLSTAAISLTVSIYIALGMPVSRATKNEQIIILSVGRPRLGHLEPKMY